MAYQSLNPNDGKLVMSFEHLSSAQLENALADANRAAILKKSCIAAAHQRRWLRATGDTGDGKANCGSSRQGGGFAEYILADPDYVAHVPAGLSAIEAVPLSCAGVTCYKGLKETNAKQGQWVVISGSGAHGVLITAPLLAAFKQGVGMTCKRGTCVLVGLTPGESRRRCSMWWRTASPRSADSSSAPGKMAEALGFAADGKVRADIDLQPLSAINDGFARLAHGEVPSREGSVAAGTDALLRLSRRAAGK